MSKTITTEEFIKRAREVHGDDFIYDKVEYKGMNVKVCIICPIHGEFWQTPHNHLHGSKCYQCSKLSRINKKTKNREQFIEEARKIHGDKYDYSKVVYINCKTKVCIICPIHGEFWQTPDCHLQGNGCQKCKNAKTVEKFSISYDEVIKRCKQIHGDKYIYLSEKESCFTKCNKKMKIICPIHGEFWQTPSKHIQGQGCSECAKNNVLLKIRKTKEQFIEDARKIHGDNYIYNNVEYKNACTKVCIICPEHGEFWQTPSHHLNGNGCPICKSSKLEKQIRNLLNTNNIDFIPQKTFEWLYNKFNLHLDYFIPSKNIAIECQGEQHFHAVDFGSKGKEFAEEQLKLNQERDAIKRKLCEEHGIKLLYYSNLHIDYPYEVIEDENELLKKILE